MASQANETMEAITKYSSFVEETLKPQLKQSLRKRDQVDAELREYSELQHLVSHLQQQQQQPQSGENALKTLMDVGERFQVRAKIPDTSMIFVDVGLNFHVEMTLSEALTFCQSHLRVLNEKRSACQTRVNEISQHVHVVLEAIEKLAVLENSARSEGSS